MKCPAILQPYLLVCCLLAAGGGVAAQQDTAAPRIRPFAHTHEAELFGGTSFREFTLRQPRSPAQAAYHLLANTHAYAGAGISYKWLNLTWVKGIPNTALDRKAPNVHVLSLSFTNKGKRLAVSAGVENVQGMLLRQATAGKSYRPVPSLGYFGAYGQFTWVFDPDRFSYRAATAYNWQQVKSGGSVMMRLRPGYSAFRINKALAAGDPLTQELTSTQWMSALVEGGYGYNYLFPGSRWSMASVLLVGAGVQKDLNGMGLAWYRNRGWSGTVTMGYNGDRFYTHLNYDINRDQQKLRNLDLYGTASRISVTFGYRIGDRHRKLLGIL